MALPRNVERQLAEAETLHQSLQDAAAQPQTDVIDNASQLAPAASAPAVEPPPPLAHPAPVEPKIDYEQKYKTIQGMYNAEVPRLQSQNRSMESDLVALKEQVRALSQAAQQAAKPAAKQATDPKDIEAFGADLIDMVQRQASASHAALRDEFAARITALEATVNGVSQKANDSLESQFYASLRAMVPDWQQINTDERWLAWLGEEDPTFGLPRQAALERAHSIKDAGRVAALFVQFKNALPKPKQESLDSQVAPTSTGAPTPTTQAEAPRQRISQKFVQSFYREVAQNKYRGREAEAARIENEINLAAAEGRIV